MHRCARILIGSMAVGGVLLACERAASAPVSGDARPASVEHVRGHVFFLADDDMRGRASGSPDE